MSNCPLIGPTSVSKEKTNQCRDKYGSTVAMLLFPAEIGSLEPLQVQPRNLTVIVPTRGTLEADELWFKGWGRYCGHLAPLAHVTYNREFILKLIKLGSSLKFIADKM